MPTVSMGGGTRVVAVHAQALRQMGHRVHVVSPPQPRSPIGERLKHLLKGKLASKNGGPPSSHLDHIGIDHRILERWRPVTNDDVPDGDIVIATWWETAEWVNALSNSKGTKIYFIQGHEIFPYLPIERVIATYRCSMQKLVVSSWLENIMISNYNDSKVRVIPNSFDRNLFFASQRDKQQRPTVGFIYASSHVKGVDVVLAALKQIRERFADIRILCFGTEPVTADLPLPPGSEIHVAPRQEDLRLLYAACDAWVTASRNEGFNLPALEAMACRTPVVATKTGWPAEAVITGENGVLVDVDNPIAIANGLEWILSQPNTRWQQLSNLAHQTAARTPTWSESSRLLEEALCIAARNGHGTPGEPYSKAY